MSGLPPGKNPQAPIPPRTRHRLRVLAIGFLLSCGYWIFESLIHLTFFSTGSFFHSLIPEDSNELWMRCLTTVLFFSFGCFSQYVSDHQQNILDQLTASNQELGLVSQRLHKAEEISKTGNWEYRPALKEFSLSSGARKILQTDQEILSQEDFFRRIDPDSAQQLERHLATITRDGLPFAPEIQVFTGNDRPLAIHFSAEYDPVKHLVFGIIQDLTERQQAERKLRDSEQRFRLLAENMSEVVCLHDREGNYSYVNPAGQRLLGYSIEEMLGRDPYSFLHPEDLKKHWEEGEFPLGQAGKSVGIAYRMRRKFGDYLWLESLTVPIYNGDGEVTHFITTSRDVTQRKLDEAARELSDESLKLAVRAAGMGIWAWDPASDEMSWNQGMYNLYGIDREEFTGLGKDYPSLTGTNHQQITEAQLKTGEDFLASPKEIRIPHPDGQETAALANDILIVDESGKPLQALGVLRDVTKLRKLEAELRQADKMQAIGRLAGGIAHDYNNQLSVILVYAQMVEELAESEELKNLAKKIIRASEWSGDLTRKLLAFSRESQAPFEPINMHDLLSELGSILEMTLPKKVSVKLDLSAASPLVLGEQSELQNALLNICLNARDAMPKGGTLTITSSNTQLDADFVKRHKYQIELGPYLVISLEDTGEGMPKEVLNHIFEPLFTTKPVGKGTGMGLASVYGTIKAHHGAVNVYSEVGEGTSFKIYLPLPEEPLNGEMTILPRAPEPGQTRVLLVDDEEAPRRITLGMLEELGYQTVAFADPQEAIAWYKKDWKSIDLVILDGVMPGLNGPETYMIMRQANPQLRAILVSGFSSKFPVKAEGFRACLDKPLIFADFARTLSLALLD